MTSANDTPPPEEVRAKAGALLVRGDEGRWRKGQSARRQPAPRLRDANRAPAETRRLAERYRWPPPVV